MAWGGAAAWLVMNAENWGLVPAAAQHLPWLPLFTKVGLSVAAGLVPLSILAWSWAGRRAERRASLNLEALAIKQVAIIRERVYSYMRRYGSWPPTLAHVGLSDTLLVNPWGQPYRYVVHGDRFTILTDMPGRIYDYLALEHRWLGGPGCNLLTCADTQSQWH
jgi:hypothetical protein